MPEAENNDREELFIPEQCSHITISGLPAWAFMDERFIAFLKENIEGEISTDPEAGIIGIVREEISVLTEKEKMFLKNYYTINPNCGILVR